MAAWSSHRSQNESGTCLLRFRASWQEVPSQRGGARLAGAYPNAPVPVGRQRQVAKAHGRLSPLVARVVARLPPRSMNAFSPVVLYTDGAAKMSDEWLTPAAVVDASSRATCRHGCMGPAHRPPRALLLRCAARGVAHLATSGTTDLPHRALRSPRGNRHLAPARDRA